MNTSKKKSTSSNRNAWLVGGVIAAVIAIAAIVAISASSKKDQLAVGTVQEFSEVAVTGDALPAFDSAANPDPAVGMTAPTLTGKSFTGNVVTTESTGTPTLTIFLAHWCPHCQREVPLLVEWEKSGKMPAGIDIVAIATGTDSANPNYHHRNGWLAKTSQPPGQSWQTQPTKLAEMHLVLLDTHTLCLLVAMAKCSGVRAVKFRWTNSPPQSSLSREPRTQVGNHSHY